MSTFDRKSFIRIFVLGLAGAVFVSWVRIRNLEKNVDGLYQIIRTMPGVITVGDAHSSEGVLPRKSVFKLIDAKPPEPSAKSSIGVSWDVERAMLGGAHEGELSRKINDPPEYAPAPLLPPPTNSAVPLELNNQQSDSN
ncbi:MAG TPA: hypothetical protein VHU84_13975 [Lacipirellulaceae bacterium]|jgi:hypothetical protein|nr:hypothetical protein [Lacipirellulaceae bacterium]